MKYTYDETTNSMLEYSVLQNLGNISYVSDSFRFCRQERNNELGKLAADTSLLVLFISIPKR